MPLRGSPGRRAAPRGTAEVPRSLAFPVGDTKRANIRSYGGLYPLLPPKGTRMHADAPRIFLEQGKIRGNQRGSARIRVPLEGSRSQNRTETLAVMARRCRRQG